MVSFTGSTRVGKLTMANAAQTLKKVSLELGGKNPQIVFPDADLEGFIDAAVFGAYFNAGECCNAGSRLILHKSIAKDFRCTRGGASRQRQGRRSARSDDAGRCDDLAAAFGQDRRLRRGGGKSAGAVVHGGSARSWHGPVHGADHLPEVTPGMAVAREEVFGPVLSVLTFETIEEAIEIANSIDYGLSAGVWSASISTPA
jgi:betaine-aldehyde dehydrogenase